LPANLARYFDAVIPWEKRLAREMPLLEEVARNAGRRILIPACGTGGHVVALAQRGFDVLGFDVDEDALEIARRKIHSAAPAIAAGSARLKRLRMENAGELGTQCDAAFCLGNALPGLSGPGQLLAAMRGVADALRPGGVFFTQNLNYDMRWREKTKFFPVLSGQTADEEVLLVKFAEYEPEFINFHAMFLARPEAGGAWQSHVRSSRQIPLFRERMIELLSQAGFGGFEFWGDYAKTLFDTAQSPDLIVLAEKANP
jgi:SAM-dependent methyltransferase